ncbi:MAG TPA: sigma-54 dependent transcriptional regulator, partial [Candidatus Eisenbacteria bacterium]|nr:sigma-54 dependent transcriptional regulator [Candidatus Eisenbacteria bacterium]
MAGEKILIVDDEDSMLQFLSILLAKEGYEVTVARSGREALAKAEEENYDIVVTDIKMPGEIDGLGVLAGIKKIDPATPVVIRTAFASQKTAIEALNRGAYQYLEKSAKNDEVRLVIKNALAMRRVQSENVLLKRQLKKTDDTKEIIGHSEQFQRVLKLVEKVADSDSTILIVGESGTGKELIAKRLHYLSGRADGPFVSINCGALPKDLLESNLFGHVKGSFTGAVRDQEGLLAVAGGGSFFLDEVGETLPATQVKLLRALQEREIIPVGGTKPRKIDVRLIAATNADLERGVAENRFRADLYYRLNVIQIRLPSLRERKDDIPELVEHFLARLTAGKEPKTLSKEGRDALIAYDWPGNVRELENVIERAVILSDDGVLTPEDLPEKVLQGGRGRGSLVIDTPSMTLDELEREYILKVLHHTGGQKKRASEILGINPSTLYRKLLAYGLLHESAGSEALVDD